MTEDKNQQELMFKLAMFEQQMNQMQQQISAVEQMIIELNSLSLGLDELVVKKDAEIFAPIGRGIFAKAKLVSEDLLVDVGGRNLVKKSIPETQKILQEQIQKLKTAQGELEINLENLSREVEGVLSEGE